MTNIQFNEITSRLANTAKQDIHDTKTQQKEFLEKINGYFKAKDDYERIDALISLAVLYMKTFKVVYEPATIDKFVSNYVNKQILNQYLKELKKEIRNSNSENAKGDFRFLNLIENIISFSGFDLYKEMIKKL